MSDKIERIRRLANNLNLGTAREGFGDLVSELHNAVVSVDAAISAIQGEIEWLTDCVEAIAGELSDFSLPEHPGEGGGQEGPGQD